MFNLPNVPLLLTQFISTVLLSFVVGLELHSYRRNNNQDLGFGTTRTLTLVGIMGFILFVIDDSLVTYVAGLAGLLIVLGVYYFRVSGNGSLSVLSIVLAILTYAIAPVLIMQPNWFVVLYVVTILIMFSQMPKIRRFSDAFRADEVVTLSKFLLMAGVVLPLLPDDQIAPFVPVTFYEAWLALLVVSSMSYASYLVQTYLSAKNVRLMTGLFGGLYSSTVTTIVLSRRAQAGNSSLKDTGAIILATAMMYARLLLIVLFLGHTAEAAALALPFGALIVISLLVAGICWFHAGPDDDTDQSIALSHPLEFRTAIVFSALFVLFAAGTSFVLQNYGEAGLNTLSLVVGVSDIDPFILSLLGGGFAVDQNQVVASIILATAGNSVAKACYAMAIGKRRSTFLAGAWLLTLSVLSLIIVHLGYMR